jgi:hypothetical protein
LLAQTTPALPDLAPLVRRLVQAGLWTPPDTTLPLLAALLVWLVGLVAIAALLQRDCSNWLRGLVDVRRHFEQLGEGLEILRRNKRPVWVLLGGAVLSWTGWSLGLWQERPQIAELEGMLETRENSVALFAWDHALTAAVVPLRALASLGDLLPLLFGACLVLFARTVELGRHLRWEMPAVESMRLKRRLGTIWVGLIILMGYRAVTFLADRTSGPVSGCLRVDALVVPLLLLAADGLLLSWVLVEFGRALREHLTWESDDTAAFVRGIPAAMLVSALANPGRYVVLAATMLEQQWTETAARPASRWGPILWASAVAQLVGLALFAFPAVLVVCRRGGLAYKLRSFITLIRRAGGQLVGLTVLAVLLNIVVTFPFFALFGAMQAETWSLLGAASYAHYATLLLGLVFLSGVTQLAAQQLGLEDEPQPVAVLLQPSVTEPVQPASVGNL